MLFGLCRSQRWITYSTKVNTNNPNRELTTIDSQPGCLRHPRYPNNTGQLKSTKFAAHKFARLVDSLLNHERDALPVSATPFAAPRSSPSSIKLIPPKSFGSWLRIACPSDPSFDNSSL